MKREKNKEKEKGNEKEEDGNIDGGNSDAGSNGLRRRREARVGGVGNDERGDVYGERRGNEGMRKERRA